MCVILNFRIHLYSEFVGFMNWCVWWSMYCICCDLGAPDLHLLPCVTVNLRGFDLWGSVIVLEILRCSLPKSHIPGIWDAGTRSVDLSHSEL